MNLSQEGVRERLGEAKLRLDATRRVLAKPSSPVGAAAAGRQRALRGREQARERKRVAVPTGVEPVFQD